MAYLWQARNLRSSERHLDGDRAILPLVVSFTRRPCYPTARCLLPADLTLAQPTTITTGFASAELYDPASGTWTTTGSLVTGRSQHTATLLPNGRVLVAAGENNRDPAGSNGLSTAELYDPSTGIWTATGSLTTARVRGQTATLLPTGKVLVAGGYNPNDFYLASAELYDPASGSWTVTGSLG